MPAVDGEARYAEEDGIMPVVSPNSNGCSSNVPIIVVERGTVTFTEAHRHFLAELRRDPFAPAPALRPGTIADFHAWKAEMRAYDQARIDLNLVTPAQLRIRNTAVRFARRCARVARHEQYA